jgi:hypothetical protein
MHDVMGDSFLARAIQLRKQRISNQIDVAFQFITTLHDIHYTTFKP